MCACAVFQLNGEEIKELISVLDSDGMLCKNCRFYMRRCRNCPNKTLMPTENSYANLAATGDGEISIDEFMVVVNAAE